MPERTVFVGPLDRILHFRTMPALDRLTPTQLGTIAQHAQEQFFPRGNYLLRPEWPAEAFYLVIDGRVTVTRLGRSAQEAGPGDAVGFHHLLAQAARGIEARADADTLALRLDWEAQLDICEQHFPILLQYVRYLAERLLGEFRRRPTAQRLGPAEGRTLPPGQRRLNLVERLLALRGAPAFPSSSVDALSELARHVVELRYAAGEAAWRRDEPATWFLLIAGGAVSCSAGELARPFGGGPTTTLGMHETLATALRWYDAVADGPVVGLRIDLEPFLDVLEDHFEMAIEFTSLFAKDLLELLEGDPGRHNGP